MSIKLSLLKSGETIISDVKELTEEKKFCGYVFHRPHKVLVESSFFLTEENEPNPKVNVSLSPWILLTEDDQILVSPDWVVTIVEPISSIKSLYEEKINENNQVSFTEC
jgi:Uma2 family endonuclease